jgi:peroxiredoxin
MKLLLTISLMLLLTGVSFAQINVGDDAPDFTYTSLENEQITLSDLRGKVVYIFFFGANCPHCKDNGPVTEDQIYQSFKSNENFVALGLDTWNTSAASVTNFKNVTGISYPLLLDSRQSLVDYYGNASAYDRSVVIGADGKVAYKGTGFVNTDYEDVNDSIESELSIATSVVDDIELPFSVSLAQNYPNPFNPSTTISYSLPEAADVSLKIYNMLGVEVATIQHGFRSSGKHTINYDASNLSSGIYIYRLQTGNISLTKRMTLLK